MHSETLGRRQHSHVFLGPRHDENERRTWAVVALTAVTMVAEIVGGTVLGSMALVADGWHMATHAGALGMAALAYRFARRHAEDERFGFGTGKFGDLAAYSSAMILGVVALLVGYESVARLYNPVSIGFDQAIAIAVLGLGVNLASAWLLREDPMHGHHAEALDGPHAHGHRHRHDHNLRAAYAHVLADALTSVLAIAARNWVSSPRSASAFRLTSSAPVSTLRRCDARRCVYSSRRNSSAASTLAWLSEPMPQAPPAAR